MSPDAAARKPKPLQVEWGKHIDQKAIDHELATGRFDAVTLIHNETSTGVMNPLPGNLLHPRQISRRRAHRRHRLVLLRSPDRDGRARHRRHADRGTKSARPSAGLFAFQRFRKSFARAEKTKRSRLLFRFSRIQKTARRIHDPEHAQHRPHFRAAIKARRNFRRRRCRRVLRVTLAPMRWSTIGCERRFRIFRRRKFSLPHSHLRQKQPRHRRCQNSCATYAKNIISSSTAATAKSKAKPSASPTWAMKPRKPSRICLLASTIASDSARVSGHP